MSVNIPKTCLNCTKLFNPSDPRGKFCSRSCSAIYNNQQNPKRKLLGECRVCKKKISSSLNFCSKDCHKVFRSQNRKAVLIPIKDSISTYYQRTKLKCIKYKGGCCEICGYNKCSAALEFHHKDPSQKDFSISGGSRSFKKLKPEIDKCILVCANCHREIHAGLVDLEGNDPSSIV